MTRFRVLVALAAAGLVLTPAVAASAQSETAESGVVDVLHTDGGAQSGMQMMSDRGKRVRVELTGQRRVLRTTLLTDAGRYALRVTPRRAAGAATLRHRGQAVRCSGLRLKGRSADRAVVVVPRSCLGDPAWVSLAVAARG